MKTIPKSSIFTMVDHAVINMSDAACEWFILCMTGEEDYEKPCLICEGDLETIKEAYEEYKQDDVDQEESADFEKNIKILQDALSQVDYIRIQL